MYTTDFSATATLPYAATAIWIGINTALNTSTPIATVTESPSQAQRQIRTTKPTIPEITTMRC